MAKFNVMEENFMHAINFNAIKETFSGKLDKFPQDMEQIFEEIFITYSTLLLMKNKEETAINVLDKAV